MQSYYRELDDSLDRGPKSPAPMPSAPDADSNDDLPPSYAESAQQWYEDNLNLEQQRILREQYLRLCQNQAALQALQNKAILDKQALQRWRAQQLYLQQQAEENDFIDYYYIDTCPHFHMTAWDYYNMSLIARHAPELVRFGIQLDIKIIQGAVKLGSVLGHEAVNLAKAVAPHLAQAGRIVGRDAIVVADAIGHEAVVVGQAVASGVSHAAHAFASGARSMGSAASTVGSGHSTGDCGKDAAGAILIIAGIAVALSALIASVAAAAYTAMKAVKSLKNIFHGEKIGKAFLRFGAIGAGAYVGTTYGIIIGGAIGSAVPIIGTTIGAVVGGIIGGGLTAGASTFVSKYAGKALTWLGSSLGLFGKKEELISKTNPSKYQLSKKQKANMEAHGVSDTMRIHAMMRAVKKQKNQLGNFTCLDSYKSDAKKDLNELLKEGIKKDPDVVKEGRFTTKNHRNYIWHNNREWVDSRDLPYNPNFGMRMA